MACPKFGASVNVYCVYFFFPLHATVLFQKFFYIGLDVVVRDGMYEDGVSLHSNDQGDIPHRFDFIMIV